MDCTTSGFLEQLRLSPKWKEFLSDCLSTNPIQQQYLSRPAQDLELQDLLMIKGRTGFLVGITIRLFVLRPEQPYSLPVRDSFDTRLAVHHAISGVENSTPGVMIAAILGWLVRTIVEGLDLSFSSESVQLAKACLSIMPVPTLQCAPDFLYAYSQGRSIGEGHEEALQRTLGYGLYTAFVLDDLLAPLKRTSMIIASIHLHNYWIIWEIFRGAGSILASLRDRWSLIMDPSTVRHAELLVWACRRCDTIQGQAMDLGNKSPTHPLPDLQQNLRMIIILIEDVIRNHHDDAGSPRPFSLAGQTKNGTNFYHYIRQLSVNVLQLQLWGWMPDYTVTNKDCVGDRISPADCPGVASRSPLDVEAMTGQPSGTSSSCGSLPQPKEGSCFDGTYAALIYECLLHAPKRTLSFPELHAWFQKHTSKSTKPNLETRIRKTLSSNPKFYIAEKRSKGMSSWYLTREGKERGAKRGVRSVPLNSPRIISGERVIDENESS